VNDELLISGSSLSVNFLNSVNKVFKNFVKISTVPSTDQNSLAAQENWFIINNYALE